MNNISEIVEKIKKIKSPNETMLIAIDGRGGSGKSTFTDELKKRLENVTIVRLDDFDYPADRKRLLEQVIKPLKSGERAKYQRYDWGTKQLEEWNEIPPGEIVIIEGVSALHELLNEYYDLRIWIECPAEVGFKRGLKRDREVYNVDTTDQWINEWMPEEEKYISIHNPQQKADMIISGENTYE